MMEIYTCRMFTSGKIAGFLSVEAPVQRARPFGQKREAVCVGARPDAVEVARRNIPRIFMVIGGPGCGKGTQCERLAREFGMEQVVMGNLLRSEAKKQSELGVQIDSIISAGNIVPGHIAMQLLQEQLRALAGKGISRVLLDGFPRNVQQMEDYENSIGIYEFALFLECDRETLRSRLLQRSTSSGRSDDEESVISVRLKNFEATTKPLLEHFEAQEKLYRVDAAESVEKVYESTRRLFSRELHEKAEKV
mmetsp:Transcript_4819/g.14523  ORF Transcript_4819/g.14523 Transcript_4819/m.14523 type:complete len:250 (+) Transcript_4819:60-809(+)